MRTRRDLLFLIIVIIIGVVIVFSWVFLPSQTPKTPTPSSRPILGSTPFPSVTLNSPVATMPANLSKEALILTLPYNSNLFSVEYYTNLDTFKVNIKENPYEENKQKAEQWFKDQGINPADIEIFWDAYPEVIK